MRLLGTQNFKTSKGEKKGYLTGILYLAPARESGYEVCPMRSEGCTAACLYTAGNGKWHSIQRARIAKTKRFFEDREAFMKDVVWDIKAIIRKAEREDLTPVIRLNGTSDIRWETVPVDGAANIMELFPEVQFYDYTKLYNRRNIPANYHLTFSRSEVNESRIPEALNNGMAVAVVFDTHKTKALPTVWKSLPVIDGDEDDLTFTKGTGVVLGLRAKGRGRKDTSGFVVEAA